MRPPRTEKKSKSVLEPEVQPQVALPLALDRVSLIVGLLLHRHLAPQALLARVQQHEILAQDDEGDDAQRTDGDEDLVALVVVRAVVGAVDLRANERANLHDDVVSRGRERALLHVEGVFGYPGAYDYERG